MKIIAVSHPIPTKYAKRIYNDGKSVFVNKSSLTKVSPGDKFIIYESRGAKAYTGWADIKYIGKQETHNIIKKYGERLMITEEEFWEYAENRPEMNVIVFENFEKFKKAVKPHRYVSIRGKYITEKEFERISLRKD